MSVNLLSNIPLFADLPSGELDNLLRSMDTCKMRDRQILFREGDRGDDFYVVVKGELEVLKSPGTQEELLLDVLREGEYLGEMSLILPGGQRTASVRARGEVVLLSLDRRRFLDLTRAYPDLSASMVRVLSQRLDATNNATFRDLTEKNRQLQSAYDELKAAQAQLIEKERMDRELQVAADIQLSILPDELPAVAGANFGAYMVPARMVGGDFYDVFPVGENKVGILIGDVADKGVPSALFMARVHALFMSEADSGRDPTQVMISVNRHITRLQKSTQFVTVLYGLLDLSARVFSYARAGHEPPLVMSSGGTVERLPYNTGMAIGLWDVVRLDEQSTQLAIGDTLLLYTDGMTDCRDAKGNLFGLERIKTTMQNFQGCSAQGFCDGLVSTLKKFQGDSKQDDDVTLVAVQISG
ncbi:MAG: cyclic nucleotide-binding domain-containing protein [Chloroflexi bacterium]|nr:cyclic nucleotide-binding domain-containing protein [Chloroflexota bacterium]